MTNPFKPDDIPDGAIMFNLSPDCKEKQPPFPALRMRNTLYKLEMKELFELGQLMPRFVMMYTEQQQFDQLAPVVKLMRAIEAEVDARKGAAGIADECDCHKCTVQRAIDAVSATIETVKAIDKAKSCDTDGNDSKRDKPRPKRAPDGSPRQ